jgi:hypothetical protein
LTKNTFRFLGVKIKVGLINHGKKLHKDKWFGLAYIHTNISLVLLTIGLNVLFDIGRVNEFKLFMMDGEYHYFESMWGVELDNWSFGVSLLFSLKPRDKRCELVG